MNLELTLEDLENTLTEIKKIDSAKGRNIITNYDDFMDRFQLLVKTKTIVLHLVKAKKYYFNRKEIMEKDSLFNAYCEIKESKLSDEDLRTANMRDYTTGNILTLTGIEQRLTALGWKG